MPINEHKMSKFNFWCGIEQILPVLKELQQRVPGNGQNSSLLHFSELSVLASFNVN